MDLFLVEKLSVKRLQQRCAHDGAGLILRIDSDGAVRLTRAEWDRMGQRFRDRIAPSARRLRWAIALQIPVAILALALIDHFPALGRFVTAIEAHLPAGLIPLLITIWLPTLAFVHHARIVLAATKASIAAVAGRPRIAVAVSGAVRRFHALELIALALFGPGAFIDLYGTISPHGLDGTPMMGRELGLTSAIGLTVFALVVLRELRHRRAAIA